MPGPSRSPRSPGAGVRIYAGAIPLALVTGWSVASAIVVMGVVTILYTYFGGLRAVVWADVLQLGVYLLGGMAALWIAWDLAGGAGPALARAAEAGKLRVFDFRLDLTATYTFVGGLVGAILYEFVGREVPAYAAA